MKRVLKRYRLAVVFGLVFLIFSSILISIKVMASEWTDNGYRAEGNGATSKPLDLLAIWGK